MISRSNTVWVARMPRTESMMKASLWFPDRMEYSTWLFVLLSASDANTWRGEVIRKTLVPV